MATLKQTEKQSGELRRLCFDFAPDVKPGVKIATVLGVAAANQNTKVGSVPVVVSAVTYDPDLRLVFAFFDAGSDREDYVCTGTAVMTDGQRLKVSGMLKVLDPPYL